MNLTEVYSGENDPFQGDLTLWLRSLPEGASATRATLTLKPVAPEEGTRFRETIRFTDDQDTLGATKTTDGNFLEVDFHARRTLLRAYGTGTNPSLQVDMGGVFIAVAADGTFLTNEDSPWPVDLSSKNDNLPALTVSRFRLMKVGTNSKNLDLDRVDFRSVPSNLQVRLGQMAPFWVRLGELTQTETSPDFSTILNYFLTDVEAENGFFQLPVVIHSDTLARLEVTLKVTYVIEQPVLPPHLNEVNLPYDFSTLPGAAEDLLTVRMPRGAVPVKGRNQAAIQGSFESSRLALGEPGETPTAGTLIVSPSCSLAQLVAVNKEIALSGIDLPLANTEPGLAGLNVSLVTDADGKPSGGILASAEVKVGKLLPDGTVWGSATLPEPFRILPGVRQWLVLQSREGDANWSVTAGNADQPTLQCSRDGGLSWRAAGGPQLKPPLSGLFRLRHVPERFTLPVQLQIGKGAGAVRRRFDEFAPAGKVEFSFDFSDKLDEQLHQPGAAPACNEVSPLGNSDFSLPRPQDATRRLFGFDAQCNWQVTGGVDLSRGINLSHERYIVISVDGGTARRIDCAGSDPARTEIDEIISAINRGTGANIARKFMELGISGTPNVVCLQLESPQGDAGEITLYPWCEVGLPECWEGSADHIRRLRLSRLKSKGGDFILLLADGALIDRGFAFCQRIFDLPCFATDSRPTAATTGAVLRQRFTVSPQCNYLLGISHKILIDADREEKHTCNHEVLEAPSWQVEWFNAEGTSLQADGAYLKVTDFEEGISISPFPDTCLVPPENAAEAELRLLHPSSSSYGLIIWKLNLTATSQVTLNGDFSRWEQIAGQDVPGDWTVESGWTEKIPESTVESGWTEKIPENGVLLRGDGPEDTVLVQETEVTAENEYLLEVKAVSTAAASEVDNLATDIGARFELNWLQDETQVGEAAVFFFERRAFPTWAWRGTAPADAKIAQLRFIQPQSEGRLAVEKIRFETPDLVEVPLTFLCESPGQLNVRDLRVTYDIPEPERGPSSTIRTVVPAVYKVKRSAMQIITLANQPTTVISGIGKRYSEDLARQGIRTVGELAAFEGHDIEGISPTRLIELRAGAELILDYAGRTTFSAVLGGLQIDKVITSSPSELARQSGQPLERIDQLQKNLRILYYLLDKSALEKMTLGDLMAAKRLK